MHKQAPPAGPLTSVWQLPRCPGTQPYLSGKNRSQKGLLAGHTHKISHILFSRGIRKHREGAGDMAEPALEDLPGMGLVTRREPEGSPRMCQSIRLPGVSATQRVKREEQTASGSGGEGRSRRLSIEAWRRAKERSYLVIWKPGLHWRQDAGPDPRARPAGLGNRWLTDTPTGLPTPAGQLVTTESNP